VNCLKILGQWFTRK